MAADRLTSPFVATAALLLLAGCNSVYGPTRPDGNWRIHETGHFLLYTRPGSFADENAASVGAILDEHYEYTRRVLDLRYDGSISAFLYNSRTDTSPAAPSDHSGVGFAETQAIGVVCVPPLNQNLANLLTHEANHVIMGRAIGRRGTAFMSEGLASAVMSPSFYPGLPAAIHPWARDHMSELPPVTELIDDERFEEVREEVAYKSSASFLLFLLERHGPGPVRELYTVPSSSFERRATAIFGRSLDELETEWRAYLGTLPP